MKWLGISKSKVLIVGLDKVSWYIVRGALKPVVTFPLQ